MAKRAMLIDSSNGEVLAHLTYAEMDEYIERGLVERLTPVKAKTHKFRLLGEEERAVKPQIFDHLEFDQCSLTAAISRANAGESQSTRAILWAQRHVRVWPYVCDVRAVQVACRLPAGGRKHHQKRGRVMHHAQCALSQAAPR